MKEFVWREEIGDSRWAQQSSSILYDTRKTSVLLAKRGGSDVPIYLSRFRYSLLQCYESFEASPSLLPTLRLGLQRVNTYHAHVAAAIFRDTTRSIRKKRWRRLSLLISPLANPLVSLALTVWWSPSLSVRTHLKIKLKYFFGFQFQSSSNFSPVV